jgi:hypothetical protein
MGMRLRVLLSKDNHNKQTGTDIAALQYRGPVCASGLRCRIAGVGLAY